MKRILFFLILLCLQKGLSAQYVYTIKADSIKITNSCDTAELIIENHTQSVPGFLFNKGRGRTEFRRGLTDLNNNTYLIGADTLNFNNILGNYYKQGGNSFGTPALLGTKDNHPLTFIQKGAEKGRIDTSGNWLFNTTQDKGYLAQFNGDIYSSGTIYQQRSIKIVPVDGVYGENTINIGVGNSVWGNANVALGQQLVVNGAGGILAFGVGFNNQVNNGGVGIFGSTDGGIAIGQDSYANGRSIALGVFSKTTGPYQFVCGGPNVIEAGYANVIAEIYFGSGVQRANNAGAGYPYTINGSGAYGANYAGGNITIAGGKGTGSGTPGSIIFSIAEPAATGTTLQTLSEKARFDANGNLGIGNTTPAAMLHVSGTGRFDKVVTTAGHRSAIRSITGNSTIVDTDEYVFVDAAGGAVTVTLPNASGRDGQTYTIKKTDNNNGNVVNIASSASQSVDGLNPYSLTNQWEFITIVANAGNWMVVAKN